MSKTMNRRAILAGAAAATASPVAALPLPSADPIYAAIDARKQTLAALYAVPAGADPDTTLVDADADAICVMLSTPPTTLDGLRALIRYVIECEHGGDEILDVIMEGTSEPEVAWDNGRPLTSGAALLSTIATTLDQLARQ
jgi:hypothetical protein